MALLTLAETKSYLNIASTQTDYDNQINSFLPELAERVYVICNNAFTSQPIDPTSRWGRFSRNGYNRDLDLFIIPAVEATFDASSATITVRGENFASAQFATGHDMFIRGSYMNDGYYEVSAVSTSTLTIASTFSATLTDEISGATVYFAVVDWPAGIKPLAASLVQFDYQERGSWKETETGGFGVYGYPRALLRNFLFNTRPTYGTRSAG